MTLEHYKKLEKLYLESNVNKIAYPSISIKVEEKKATLHYETDSDYFHALNALHGSVYFKLLDDAAFFAANSIVMDAFLLTSSFNIHFLRPITQGKLTAIGKLKSKSRNIFIAEASLFNENGKEVGCGTGTFARSRILLGPEMGYKL